MIHSLRAYKIIKGTRGQKGVNEDKSVSYTHLSLPYKMNKLGIDNVKKRNDYETGKVLLIIGVRRVCLCLAKL